VNERVRFTVDIVDGIVCVKAGQVGVVVQVNAGATYPYAVRPDGGAVPVYCKGDEIERVEEPAAIA